MTWYIPNVILEAARCLRKDMTDAEKKLWEKIKWKKLWVKFLRQKPIYLYTEDTGHDRYIIPDFCVLDIKLIIEVDWEIHNKSEVYFLDRVKEGLLLQKWFKILRFKNEEILNNINIVIEKIVASFP